MAYSACLSQNSDHQIAVQSVCDEVTRGLAGERAGLLVAFIGGSHGDRLEQIVEQIHTRMAPQVLLACTCEGVACGGTEVESGPSLSLWGGTLKGARLDPFHVTFENTPDGVVCDGLPDPPADMSDTRAIVLLGDPFSCPIYDLIDRLAIDFPCVPLVGGMASYWKGQRDPKLAIHSETVPRGAVGVIIRGGPAIRFVVSQGSRPVGVSFVATKAERNVVMDLGGKAALTRLEQTYGELSQRDRSLIRAGLHVGIAIDEYKDSFHRGDFLISQVISADKETGAIQISNPVKTGQTVQFHVRDADAAADDLKHLLDAQQQGRTRGGGALLFSCNGRGSNFFSQPNVDAGAIQEVCGPAALAGFFARGEFGPIGGRNFIHGFTASVALFDDDSPPPPA